jgi:hypothetical protein
MCALGPLRCSCLSSDLGSGGPLSDRQTIPAAFLSVTGGRNESLRDQDEGRSAGVGEHGLYFAVFDIADLDVSYWILGRLVDPIAALGIIIEQIYRLRTIRQ